MTELAFVSTCMVRLFNDQMGLQNEVEAHQRNNKTEPKETSSSTAICSALEKRQKRLKCVVEPAVKIKTNNRFGALTECAVMC